MLAALAGALLAIGLLVIIDGLFPKRVDLATRLSVFNDDVASINLATPDSLISSYALTLLENVKGEKLELFAADVAVTGSNLQHVAVEKLKAAGGAAALTAALSVFFGWVSSPLWLMVVAGGAGVVGYNLPDIELKKKAAERRIEFSRALTAFMTLLTSSIAGGGGINNALNDASLMGEGWVFVHIRDALDEANLSGTSSWVALERLGRDLNISALIELAGSLTLAGTSGARVTETLIARAESSRAKELAEVRADAEAKSSKLGLPVGLIMLAWAGFMAFPAILNLTGA